MGRCVGGWGLPVVGVWPCAIRYTDLVRRSTASAKIEKDTCGDKRADKRQNEDDIKKW